MSGLLTEQGYRTMTQLVLLAGATGMLGRRIAHHLTREPDARLRLLLRPGTMADARKAKALSGK